MPSPERVSTRFPLLTAVSLTLTVALTATRLGGTGVEHALRRDPDALGSGELWRLLSPVLVQTDPSWFAVVSVFVTCAVIGVIGERVFSRPRWAALYLVGALARHGIGEVFQPRQGGTSGGHPRPAVSRGLRPGAVLAVARGRLRQSCHDRAGSVVSRA